MEYKCLTDVFNELYKTSTTQKATIVVVGGGKGLTQCFRDLKALASIKGFDLKVGLVDNDLKRLNSKVDAPVRSNSLDVMLSELRHPDAVVVLESTPDLAKDAKAYLQRRCPKVPVVSYSL